MSIEKYSVMPVTTDWLQSDVHSNVSFYSLLGSSKLEERYYRPLDYYYSPLDLVNRIDNRIIKNLYDHVNYLNRYVGYLLGTESSEDFEKFAEGSAKDFEQLDKYELKASVLRLIEALDRPLDEEEISTMLNVRISELRSLSDSGQDIFIEHSVVSPGTYVIT